MPDKKKVVFHWSSGKDSALALFRLLQKKEFQVDQLLTTINEHYQRVTMHGTPYPILQRQLDATGIDWSTVSIPKEASMDIYEERMNRVMSRVKENGYTYSAYGDIFLADLKKYRESEMEKMGMKTVFPLWQEDTRMLIDEFIDSGFKAIVVCANDTLGKKFLGREIDHSFIADLPNGIDPCGENGEFHTFCYDGPIFKQPIQFQLGEKIKRSYPDPSGKGLMDFWFIDIIDLEPFSKNKG
ncbi:Dph6-related ATP pyrophosphatase [Ekhidna sp.]